MDIHFSSLLLDQSSKILRLQQLKLEEKSPVDCLLTVLRVTIEGDDL